MPNARKAIFPYGMIKNPDGSWTFFNRDYKPVGLVTKDWVDYDDPRHKLSLKGLGPSTLARLDCKGKGTGDQIWFYNDSCIPGSSAANTKSYFDKLEILLSLKEKA